MTTVAAKKIPGVDLLEVGGIRSEWNAVSGGYWSVTGAPRMLQSGDGPVLPVAFQAALATPRSSKLSNDISGLARVLGVTVGGR